MPPGYAAAPLLGPRGGGADVHVPATALLPPPAVMARVRAAVVEGREWGPGAGGGRGMGRGRAGRGGGRMGGRRDAERRPNKLPRMAGATYFKPDMLDDPWEELAS